MKFGNELIPKDNNSNPWNSIYYPFASSAKNIRPKITNNQITITKVL